MNKILIGWLFCLSIVMATNSIDIKSLYLKSYNYEQMGKYGEAIKVLTPLIQKYPNGYTLNLRIGWLFYLNKNYNDAIAHYKKAILINPYSLDPHLGLVKIYLDIQSYEKAQEKAYEVLKIDYYNYYANIYAIQALVAQKKYDIALKITNKMLALYPTNISFLELLAVIYKATNNKYLTKLYDDILILDPNNVYVKSHMHKN